MQVELGLIDRVAFSSKYSYNQCLQAISGECSSSRSRSRSTACRMTWCVLDVEHALQLAMHA